MSRAVALFSNPDVQQALAIIACALIPSLITALSRKPGAATNAGIAALQWLLDRLSLLTHSNSPGTLKFPLTGSGPASAGADPQNTPRSSGFVSLPVLVLLAVIALLLPAAAHAQATAPGPTAPPVTTSSFGGCLTSGKVCFQPSAVITTVAINVTKGQVEGSFSPGLGYGVTFYPGNWYAFGVDVTGIANPATQDASIAVLGKFANGYLRIGWGKSFLNDHSTRVLFGVGVDL